MKNSDSILTIIQINESIFGVVKICYWFFGVLQTRWKIVFILNKYDYINLYSVDTLLVYSGKIYNS